MFLTWFSLFLSAFRLEPFVRTDFTLLPRIAQFLQQVGVCLGFNTFSERIFR